MGEDLKGEKQFMTVKAGYYLEQKNRDFSIRNIGYAPASFATFGNAALAVAPIDQILSEQNINTTDGLKLDEDTKPADSYNAANRLVAGYLMLSIPYKRWNFSGGLRAEQNRQTLSSFTIQNQPLDVIQDTLLLLPSANFSYNIGEKSLVRASFGKTVNRPEFREMAPYYFYDFVFNSIYSGNSTIKFATATNYDLRWEFYPKPTELISAGVFYKQFNNPIEMYFLTGAGGGGTRSFIPGNANMATSYGLEVDIRKSLAETFSNKILNKFSVVANFSLIQSEVKLAESDANTGVANKRAMMGQSPYVVNLGLYYQNDDLGLSMSALYNVVGPRIVIVGIPGIPEVFEMPRNLLDLSITKSITDNWSVRFGAQDLLNQKFALLQDANGDGKLNRETDQVMQSYRRGTYYSLSIRYQFKK
jgi:TonB-dependent receptor